MQLGVSNHHHNPVFRGHVAFRHCPEVEPSLIKIVACCLVFSCLFSSFVGMEYVDSSDQRMHNKASLTGSGYRPALLALQCKLLIHGSCVNFHRKSACHLQGLGTMHTGLKPRKNGFLAARCIVISMALNLENTEYISIIVNVTLLQL